MKTILLFIGIFIFSFSYSFESIHGDWRVDLGQDYSEAYTTNSSKSLLGIFCLGDGDCFAYLDDKTTCVSGDKAPMLLVTDKSSEDTRATCIVLPSNNGTERHFFAFRDTDMISLMRDGNKITIAVPLKNAGINVSKFSLRGFIDASSKAAKHYGTSSSEFADTTY
jgi:hypothetical protein